MISYPEYRKLWNKTKNGHPTKVPTHVDIELSSVCNLGCPMCPQGSLSTQEKAFVDIPLVKKIIDECHDIGVMSIKLNWRGESTLHPRFEEIVKYTHGKFTDVMLNTNGMYNFLKSSIIKNYFTTVIFSVDTLDQSIAEQVRPGSNINLIKSNIRFLLGHIKNLQINHTIQQKNWLSLKELQDFCKKYKIQLNTRLMFPRTDYERDFIKTKINIKDRKNCGYPFQRLTIAHDGAVYPCCVSWSGNESIGNSRETSIKNLWNSERMERYKTDAFNAAYSQKICLDCTSWQSYVTEEI